MKKRIALATAIIVTFAAVGLIYYFTQQPYSPGNTITASSNDMAPAIQRGAKVTFDRNVAYSDLKVNDISVFHRNGEGNTYIGRIVDISSQSVVAKGDNNPTVYLGYITPEFYAGKVTSIVNPA